MKLKYFLLIVNVIHCPLEVGNPEETSPTGPFAVKMKTYLFCEDGRILNESEIKSGEIPAPINPCFAIGPIKIEDILWPLEVRKFDSPNDRCTESHICNSYQELIDYANQDSIELWTVFGDQGRNIFLPKYGLVITINSDSQNPDIMSQNLYIFKQYLKEKQLRLLSSNVPSTLFKWKRIKHFFGYQNPFHLLFSSQLRSSTTRSLQSSKFSMEGSKFVISINLTLPEVRLGISSFVFNRHPIIRCTQDGVQKHINDFICYWKPNSQLLPVFLVGQSAKTSPNDTHSTLKCNHLIFNIYFINHTFVLFNFNEKNAENSDCLISVPVPFNTILYYDRFADLHIVENIDEYNWPSMCDEIVSEIQILYRYVKQAYKEFEELGMKPEDKKNRPAFKSRVKEIATNSETLKPTSTSSSSSSSIQSQTPAPIEPQVIPQRQPAPNPEKPRWADICDSDEEIWSSELLPQEQFEIYQ